MLRNIKGRPTYSQVNVTNLYREEFRVGLFRLETNLSSTERLTITRYEYEKAPEFLKYSLNSDCHRHSRFYFEKYDR